MKYAVNNRGSFLDYRQAFLMGLLQSIFGTAVETVCLFVVLSSQTSSDVVFNFIAMAVISEFDNFVYASLRMEKLKDLTSQDNADKLLRVSYTTSSKAKTFRDGGEASDQVDENGEPICVKISFWHDRSCMNKLLYLVYRLNRSFFVGIYFYFYPPLQLVLTFILPAVFRVQYKQAWVEVGNDLEADPIITPSDSVLRQAKLTPASFEASAEYALEQKEQYGDFSIDDVDAAEVRADLAERKQADQAQPAALFQTVGAWDHRSAEEAAGSEEATLGWKQDMRVQATIDLDRALEQ